MSDSLQHRVHVENTLLHHKHISEFADIEQLVKIIHHATEEQLEMVCVMVPIAEDNSAIHFIRRKLFDYHPDQFDALLKDNEIKGTAAFFAALQSDFSFEESDTQEHYIFLTQQDKTQNGERPFTYIKQSNTPSPTVTKILKSYY